MHVYAYFFFFIFGGKLIEKSIQVQEFAAASFVMGLKVAVTFLDAEVQVARNQSSINKFVSLQYTNSDLQIGVRERLRVGVLSSEQVHFEKFRPLNLIIRVLSTEISYLPSSSYSNLKVAKN